MNSSPSSFPSIFFDSFFSIKWSVKWWLEWQIFFYILSFTKRFFFSSLLFIVSCVWIFGNFLRRKLLTFITQRTKFPFFVSLIFLCLYFRWEFFVHVCEVNKIDMRWMAWQASKKSMISNNFSCLSHFSPFEY